MWAIRRLLVTAADESGVSRWLASCGMRAGRYRLVLAGKGLFGDSLPGQRSAVRADYPARRMVKPVQRQD